MSPAEIRTARLAYPLTQAELGAIVGVSGRVVRSWEAGVRNPRPYHLRALEGIFGRWSCFAIGCACRCHGPQLRGRSG